MTLLLSGLALFLLTHSVSIISHDWRNAMVARLGLWGWKALYALPSLIGFALIVIGYGEARANAELLYSPAPWLRHVALLLLLPVFPLLLAAYLPGKIKSLSKHPMLLATKLWAAAHLLANGSAADVALFGGFLLWAIADRISQKKRNSQPVLMAPATAFNDVIAVLVGLGIYAAFLMGTHKLLIGVAPLG